MINRIATKHPRLLSIAVAALITLAPNVASARPTQAAGGQVSFMAAEYSTQTLPFWQAFVKGFQAANPGITVKLQMIGWQQNHDTTVRDIAARQLPDLVNTATIWLPEWVKSGAIRTIGPDLLPAKVASDFVPVLLNKGAYYNGQVWGIPLAAATRAMYYNKDLFQKAGIASPPATWDQLYNDVVAIHSKTGNYGYAFDGSGVQAFRYFGFFLWNAGGDFFTSHGKAAFNGPAGVTALSFLLKLVKSGAVPDPTAMTISDVEPLFQAGKLGMMIDGSYQAAILHANAPKLSFGAAAVPISSPSVKPVTWGVTDTLIVSKKADPALASKFIQYFYSPAVHAKFDINEGFLPLTKSEAALPAFKAPLQQAFIKTLPNSRFDPLNPNYSKMQDLLKTAIQQAMKGDATPQQALDTAASTFNRFAS